MQAFKPVEQCWNSEPEQTETARILHVIFGDTPHPHCEERWELHNMGLLHWGKNGAILELGQY